MQPIAYPQKKNKSNRKLSFSKMCQTMLFSYKDPTMTKIWEKACPYPTQKAKEHLQINFVFVDLDLSFREISTLQDYSNTNPDDLNEENSVYAKFHLIF